MPKATSVKCAKRSLLEANPSLAEQWHPSKNGTLTPSDVTPGMGIKVWWKCPKGDDHEWPASINNRSKGAGCPICANQRVAISNSLGTVNPNLAKQWHKTKNGDLTPFDVLPSANIQIWWECAHNPNHVWKAKLNNRANGKGCPYCANQKVSRERSLGTTHPELAEQWHPTRNGNLTPFDVVPGSISRVFWKCPRGDDHEWEATVNHRTGGTGCPICNPVWSIPELRIYCEMKTFFPAIQHRARIDGIELDIYIPELQIGIEYDGVYWHLDKVEKDRTKNLALPSSVLLIRIREDDLPLIGSYDFNEKKRGMSVNTIKKLLSVILKVRRPPKATEDEIERYIAQQDDWVASRLFDQLYTERKITKPEDSLAQKLPNLASEWHPTKNEPLRPENLTAGSGIRVWWLGKCGHEWQDTINHRSRGRDCPKCRYRKASTTWKAKRAVGQLTLID
jgi:hypothetical protein